MKRLRLWTLLAWVAPGWGAMSVEKAYEAIPHQRTVFDPQAAQKMTAEESRFLVRLFHWADQAIVAKMEVIEGASIETAYQAVDKDGAALHPTERLRGVHERVAKAVAQEKAYLTAWRASGKPFDRNDRRVQQASQDLHAAYNELMALYPEETPHNKKAFFDYLCALDFI